MTTRRRFLQQSALLIGTQAAAEARRGPARPAARAAVKGWHMAEENAPQARAFIAFGAQQAIWEDYTPDVQAALGRIARAIAAFQPVTVYCRPEERRLAEHHCGAARVRFEEAPLDDIWIRDIGPVFLADGQGSVAGVDFNFNGWATSSATAPIPAWPRPCATAWTSTTCAAIWSAKAAASRPTAWARPS